MEYNKDFTRSVIHLASSSQIRAVACSVWGWCSAWESDVFSPIVHHLHRESDGSWCIHSVGLHTYILSLLGVGSEHCVTVLTVKDYANQPTPLLFLASLSFASASPLCPLRCRFLQQLVLRQRFLVCLSLNFIERLSPLSSRHWSRPLSSHRWALSVHHQFLWEGTQQVGLWFTWDTEVTWHYIRPLSSVCTI